MPQGRSSRLAILFVVRIGLDGRPWHPVPPGEPPAEIHVRAAPAAERTEDRVGWLAANRASSRRGGGITTLHLQRATQREKATDQPARSRHGPSGLQDPAAP